MASKKKSAVDELLQAASDLRPREVKQLTFDPVAARNPAKKGLALIEGQRAVLKKKFPGFVLAEFDSLLELLDRVAEQQRLVQLATSNGALKDALPTALSWRKQLLSLAQGLAVSGKVDAKKVAAIESGTGPSDNLRDVVDLAALLAPFKAQAESLYGAGALANAVTAAKAGLAALGGDGNDDVQLKATRELRDRYATVFLTRWDGLKAAVAALFGYSAVEQRVPSLSPGSAKKSPPVPQPTPS